nr:Wadjet anti-phage system protein JetD domain-containing protein [Tessaracoccus sp. SD287]
MTADVRRWLGNRWHTNLAGVEPAFPRDFPLGRPSASELRQGYSAVHALTVEWQEWARTNDVALTYATRLATGGTRQTVPTHARLESIDHAASVIGGDWPVRLARGRARLDVLRAGYPALVNDARLLRMVDDYSDVDFEVLLKVADWYLAEPGRAKGVTPRQVPIPGVHAKWLQSHLPAVRALTGLDDLDLLPAHPARIHFTYLDPAHRAAAGRIHDSATVSDRFEPAYLPRVVVISENKDTAIHFPELAGGISVEGVGRGGKTVAAFPWLREAPSVVYWGDMDRDGYEILDGYRLDLDRDIDSVLMDTTTYATFERYGTNLDRRGNPLAAGAPRVVERLRAEELAVYSRLVDPEHRGHRRVEQERIPLGVALDAVLNLVASDLEEND